MLSKNSLDSMCAGQRMKSLFHTYFIGQMVLETHDGVMLTSDCPSP